jgi:predicted AlkP superfamily pyrophosphatase or phosphodiesterase
MKTSWSLLLVIFIQFSCDKINGSERSSVSTEPYVILVSFDGFSHEYVNLYDTPNLDKFILEGSSASKMISSFPSKTFPNHYTIVTGLYPGNHGLVDNSFYDPVRKEIYRVGNRERVEDAYYYQGTPLWQLVQQNEMKSASYFWVGSEAPVSGSFPDYYKIYEHSVPNESRIEQVLAWLNLPDNSRPRFISLYFSILDDIGHEYGPYSEEIKNAVMEADRLVGLLMSGLATLPFEPNVILTSDHGMYPMNNKPESFIYFDKLLDVSNESFLGLNNGTHAHIYSISGGESQVDSLYNLLSNSRTMDYDVYIKSNVPDHWNYQNDRVGDILIVANPGKYLIKSTRGIEAFTDHWGMHGFDPYVCDEVGAVFYANGPNIAVNKKIEAFENIHVYPFIALILGMDTPEIDGKVEVLESIYLNEN